MNSINAQLLALYEPTTKESKSDPSKTFTTQLALIEFNQDSEYPSRLAIQFGQKQITELVPTLSVNSYYTFSLNFRANEWKNPETNVSTAFNTISCWKAVPLGQVVTPMQDGLPF